MEKDIALGSVGEVKLEIAGGKALVSVSVNESVLEKGVVLQAVASASLDALALIDLLFAEIEKKLPAGVAPIEELVKAAVKSAVAAIV